MSSVRLAVRPKVVVNEVSEGMQGFPAKFWGRTHNAIGWLGDRYLCFKPINKRKIVSGKLESSLA